MKRKSKLAICFIAYIFINFSIGCSGNSKIQPMPTPTPIPMLLQTLSSTPIPADIPVVKTTTTLTPTPKFGSNNIIAFTCLSSVHFPISFLNLEDGSIKDLSHNGFGSIAYGEWISWSPDGQMLAFTGIIPPFQFQQADIFIMNADGSGLTRLTHTPQGKSSVAWSPDGKSIIYVYSTRDYPSDLALVSTNGKTSIILTATKGGEFYPTWSPDGKQIAYIYWESSEALVELRIMELEGRAVRRIDTVPIALTSIDWSPDGEWIAFASTEKENDCGEIYVIRPDGSDLTKLTSLSGCAEDVVWSTDGNYLAFIGKDDTASNIENLGWQIYIMDFANKSIVAVTDEREWVLRDIDWRPLTEVK